MKRVNFILVLFMVLGVILIGIGASWFILANIGSDPFNVLNQGIANVTGITVGMAINIINVIFTVLGLAFGRHLVRAGTIITIFVLGPVVDIGIYLFGGWIHSGLPFLLRLLAIVMGCLVIAFGIAIVYNTKLGMTPNDVMALILAEKTKFQYRWVRMSYDITLVIIGIFLGGVFGIGTIICALLTGPAIQYFMPLTERIINIFFKAPSNAEIREAK